MSASYFIRPFTVLFVLILSSFSDGQLFHSSANSLAIPNLENEFKIELIDVKCDKDQDGMHVTINFSRPFGGVIYSQGYFNDPKCKYVSIGENKNSYEFVVPLKGCGSKPSCAICDSIENILVIQQDEEVQGEFDTARKVSCSRTGIDEEKKVFFKPFVVDMLDVITVPTAHGGVDCWMDIQRGVYPKLTAIGDSIKIGEELTVLVYLRDDKKEYDLSVRNCWAYDNEDFDDKKTGKVQLSDASGCSMKRKLFGIWQKTPETGSSGATLVLHNTLRAFKFPDEAQVYLKCDIEICRGTCAEAICDDDFIGMKDVDCKVYPSHSKCLGMNIIERFTTPLPPKRFTTSTTKSYDKITTYRVDSRYPFDVTTTITGVPETESTTIQTTESNFFYNPTRRPGFGCYEGSTDPKCIQQKLVDLPTTLRPRGDYTYPNLFKTTTKEPKGTSYPDLMTTTVKDATPSIIYKTTTRKPETFTFYPDLGKPSTFKPQDQIKTTTQRPTFCQLYPNSQRCISQSSPKPQTTTKRDESLIEILTFKPPKTQIDFVCSNNPNDIRCRQLVIPNCEPDAPYDSRCFNPKSTGAPTYLPPSTTLPTRSTGKFLICVPGANGECEGETERTTTEGEITTKTAPTQFVTRPKPVCSFGSTDPECKKVTTNILTLKPEPITTKIPTTRQNYFTTSTTSRPQFKCYPGSSDPRCAMEILDCDKNPSDIRCNQVIVPLKCGPGFPYDARCEKSATTKAPATFFPFISTTRRPTPSTTKRIERPLCTFGSTNPECKKLTTNILTLKPEPSTTAIPITEQPITESSSFESSTFRLQSTTTPRLISTTKQPITVTTKSYPSKAPICYPGTLDPRCLSLTTKKIVPPSSIPLITTTEPSLIFSTTETEPKCFPGSLDARCGKPITTQVPSIITSRISSKPETTTPKIYSKAPNCYPGALDPRCASFTTKKVVSPSSIPLTTTTEQYLITSTIEAEPKCLPGSLDTRCRKLDTTRTPSIYSTYTYPTTERRETTSKISFEPETTTPKIYSKAPICYPGALDPRCAFFTTKKIVPPSSIPLNTTTEPYLITSTIEAEPKCSPGSSDVRCKKLITTKASSAYSTYSYPTTERRETTTAKIFSKAPICYPGALDPRCRSTITTERMSSSSETLISTTSVPKILKGKCYPGSLDPSCNQVEVEFKCGPGYPYDVRCPNPTPTATPPTYLPPKPTGFTTSRTTEKVKYETTTYPSRTSSTQKSIPTAIPAKFTERPSDSTENLITSTKTTTKKVPRVSSPRPFTARPPIQTSTENLLCYPGSPIPGCKSSEVTTPSFCFPGSKDRRCPQLPDTFSTRQPSTYLPPFLDSKSNRVRRSLPVASTSEHETIKFQMSFKSLNFA